MNIESYLKQNVMQSATHKKSRSSGKMMGNASQTRYSMSMAQSRDKASSKNGKYNNATANGRNSVMSPVDNKRMSLDVTKPGANLNISELY